MKRDIVLHFYTRELLLLRRPPCWNKHVISD